MGEGGAFHWVIGDRAGARGREDGMGRLPEKVSVAYRDGLSDSMRTAARRASSGLMIFSVTPWESSTVKPSARAIASTETVGN